MMEHLAGYLLLAHEGGWDEAAILLGPVIVFLVIRYLARRPPEHAVDAVDAGETDGVQATPGE
ncbi:MAG TPA: hypothetical protein VGA69_10825, partial [Nitriliruptorales bacterium]